MRGWSVPQSILCCYTICLCLRFCWPCFMLVLSVSPAASDIWNVPQCPTILNARFSYSNMRNQVIKPVSNVYGASVPGDGVSQRLQNQRKSLSDTVKTHRWEPGDLLVMGRVICLFQRIRLGWKCHQKVCFYLFVLLGLDSLVGWPEFLGSSRLWRRDRPHGFRLPCCTSRDATIWGRNNFWKSFFSIPGHDDPLDRSQWLATFFSGWFGST